MQLFNIEKVIAVGSSVLTAVAPKLCCWSSAFALAGVGSGYLTWVYPIRHYLWGLSFVMLAVSMYQVYKPSGKICAGCKASKSNFFNQKTITWGILIFVIALFILSIMMV